jgi:hypothetical protein
VRPPGSSTVGERDIKILLKLDRMTTAFPESR